MSLSLFDIFSSFFKHQWQECSPLPHPQRCLQAVEYKDKIYVGSGSSVNKDENHLIYCYDLKADKWEEEYLKSVTRYFAMTVYKENIVLVNGMKMSGDISSNTQCLSEDMKEIVPMNIPPIHTARMGASAVSADKYLIVAGGLVKESSTYKFMAVLTDSDERSHTDVIEMFNGEQWLSLAKLPSPCGAMKSVLLDKDKWFLLGGSNQGKEVFSTSLNKLVETVPTDDPSDMANIWNKVADLPYEYSSVCTCSDEILVLGGVGIMSSTSENFVYDKRQNKWTSSSIPDLPVPLCNSTALTLTSGDIMVIGGQKSTGEKNIRNVYKYELAVLQHSGLRTLVQC